MLTLKPQVAKVSTVRVEKTFALVVQHSQRKCESHLVLHSSKLRFITCKNTHSVTLGLVANELIDIINVLFIAFRCQ